MAMRPEISVKDLLMQAFLTGWELSDKSISQDEYLQSAIQVIEVLQVEPICSARTVSGSITVWKRRTSS